MNDINIGNEIYELCKVLYPINRSITGNGVRSTLSIIKNILPDLNIFEIPSGTKCFDWEVPLEWEINEAFVIDPDGNKILDFKDNNLHIISYSEPVNKVISLEELQNNLYSIEDLPDAIPYVTSYYNSKWGFCISHNKRNELKEGQYHVFIDAKKFKGSLTYGELIIKGKSKEEIMLSTYICHPSLANNELSGPTVTTFLVKWLLSTKRKYTYRIIFIPETIGSIYYLSKYHRFLKDNLVAGLIVTCVGDDNNFSYMPTKYADKYIDKVIKHVLLNTDVDFKEYSFLDRGSDERQYCSPGIDLPFASIMRSKYATYKEYHTSLDNLEFINPNGLKGSYDTIKRTIEVMENNKIYKSNILCEPKFSKYSLYPNDNTFNNKKQDHHIYADICTYINGRNDLIDIANTIELPIWDLYDKIELLINNKIIS
jgi:aminopeptidase-like protein